MATVKSTAVISGVIPDYFAPGVVMCRSAIYTATAALAANDVIQMVPVKNGVQILGITLKWSAFGAARTIDVGDDGDIDRFFDGIDVSAAGDAEQWQDGATAGKMYEYSGLSTDNTIQTIDIKVLGDTMPADAWIKMDVTYKQGAGVIDDEG